MKEIILNMYFNDNLRQIEIAKKLDISKYKVSRIVVADSRYIIEKEIRKRNNKIKHIENTKKYIKSMRDRIDIEYKYLRQQHLQASIELSKSNKIMSNKSYRNWNSSAYEYDQNNNYYKLKKELNVGYDVPKKINWNIKK